MIHASRRSSLGASPRNDDEMIVCCSGAGGSGEIKLLDRDKTWLLPSAISATGCQERIPHRLNLTNTNVLTSSSCGHGWENETRTPLILYVRMGSGCCVKRFEDLFLPSRRHLPQSVSVPWLFCRWPFVKESPKSHHLFHASWSHESIHSGSGHKWIAQTIRFLPVCRLQSEENDSETDSCITTRKSHESTPFLITV